MAIILERFDPKKPEDKSLVIDGVRVRHLASQDRLDRSVTWDDGLRREDYKRLEGNANAVFAKTSLKLHRATPIDVMLVKDDEEIAIYEIL